MASTPGRLPRRRQLAAKRPAVRPAAHAHRACRMPPSPVGPLRTIEDIKPDYQIVATEASSRNSAHAARAEKTLALAFDLDAKGSCAASAFSIEAGPGALLPWQRQARALRRRTRPSSSSATISSRGLRALAAALP